jgi:hypothetical protein
MIFAYAQYFLYETILRNCLTGFVAAGLAVCLLPSND